MSSRSINFLQSYQKKISKQVALDLRLLQISGAIFGVVLVFTLAAVGVSFGLQTTVSNGQTQIKDLEREILSQEEVEKSVVLLVRKLTVLTQLFEERDDKQDAISYFTNLFGPTVLLQEIDYDSKGGILSLRIQSPSIFEMDRVFELVSSSETAEKFGSVKTSQLQRDATGKYSVTITVVLNKDDVKPTVRPRPTAAPAAE